MVILIGGSSHVGKTLISQKLMSRHLIPYLSLDHLKMGFIRSHMTDLTVEDDYEMRYFMWPYVSELIKTVIENDQNLIIEGCYIPGEWKETFTADYLNHIRCVFIVMSESYLREHFEEISHYANAIEKRKDDHPDLERLIRCSKDFKEECSQYDIPCFEIDQTFCPDQIVRSVEQLLGL